MAIFNKGDTMAKETSTTIISQGAKLKGDFNLSAKLHIEGEVEGNINSTNQISVGKSGAVKGEIVCSKFILNGKFNGKIECDILEITDGGMLNGEIIIKDLIIEKGGVFEGTSTLKKKDASKKS
jgi:cytoskeletal protein CcmA (bactofilin family)